MQLFRRVVDEMDGFQYDQYFDSTCSGAVPFSVRLLIYAVFPVKNYIPASSGICTAARFPRQW